MNVKYSSLKANATARLRKKLAERFGSGLLSAKTSEETVNISALAINFDVNVTPGISVLDGSAALGRQEGLADAFSCRVREFDILKPVIVKDLVLPNEQRARIRQSNGIKPPRLRTMNPLISAPLIRKPACESISLPAIKTGDTHISTRQGNRIPISQILDLPHVRSSVDISLLPDLEYEGFLREAETLKGLPVTRFELQAVFRHVPVELISQICFVEERNAIIYRLSESRRTRTRVHDMAAVRDTTSEEIHLVPHRTRFRWASLN
jgi:hypothetical protein